MIIILTELSTVHWVQLPNIHCCRCLSSTQLWRPITCNIGFYFEVLIPSFPGGTLITPSALTEVRSKEVVKKLLSRQAARGEWISSRSAWQKMRKRKKRKMKTSIKVCRCFVRRSWLLTACQSCWYRHKSMIKMREREICCCTTDSKQTHLIFFLLLHYFFGLIVWLLDVQSILVLILILMLTLILNEVVINASRGCWGSSAPLLGSVEREVLLCTLLFLAWSEIVILTVIFHVMWRFKSKSPNLSILI